MEFLGFDLGLLPFSGGVDGSSQPKSQSEY